MNQDEYTKEIAAKYKKRIASLISNSPEDNAENIISADYKEFKKEMEKPKLSFYEKLCSLSENLLKVAPDKKTRNQLEYDIETCHLNITPEGATSFSVFFPLIGMLLAIFTIALVGFLNENYDFFMIFFFLALGMFAMIPLQKIPSILATRWRMKSSNQMVLSIFYIVTYMRHTSNLELAIRFAANHLIPPLSIDFKKILWDVESGKFRTLKDSLNNYLMRWKGYNDEFIEVFRIIESSLYEGSETRRIEILNRALSFILDETYEKMLHFAQDLKGPIDSLNMIGIVLPILSLIMLPLVAGLMEGVKWYHILLLYDVLLPFAVFYMAIQILSTRPTGYGGGGIEEELLISAPPKKQVDFAGIKFSISPILAAISVFLVLFLIGLSPLIMHAMDPTFDIEIIPSVMNFLGYTLNETTEQYIGPFGIGAVILSLFISLAFGLSIAIYFNIKYSAINKQREEAALLEKQFSSALFQLGNRLADGIPAELAIENVATIGGDNLIGRFFRIIADNIKRLGMGINEAIFDRKHGAIMYYPSNMIESSMKVLSQSVTKGPLIASIAMLNVSEYLKQIHRVNERLRDLLSDIITSIKSQMNFLTPVIGGVVVGITGLLSNIINLVNEKSNAINSAGLGGESVPGAAGQFQSIFSIGIPTYFFQIVVGIYVVEVIIIMSYLASTIEKGEDSVYRKYTLGKSLSRGIILYFLVSTVVSIMFSLITVGISQFMA